MSNGDVAQISAVLRWTRPAKTRMGADWKAVWHKASALARQLADGAEHVAETEIAEGELNDGEH